MLPRRCRSRTWFPRSRCNRICGSDPPVGWRVPEPPPVEETLPTSPLIQIDTPPLRSGG